MSDTKARIVEAAQRLFHEQGYAATGVATILREADVRSGSLYHFFSSKEALLEAVLDCYLEGLRPVVIAPIEAATADPIERIFRLFDFYREAVLQTEFSYGCPIGNLALEVGAGDSAVTRKIDANLAAWRKAVEEWVRAAAPRFQARVDPSDFAALVLSVMEGAVMQARTSKSIERFDASVGEFRRYVALLTEESDTA
ncbi:MAG: TetR/AcrR family transcriptional regulator [Parvularculaceae bacterium]